MSCRAETRVERNESRVGDTVDQKQVDHHSRYFDAHGQWSDCVTALKAFAGNERQAASNKALSKRPSIPEYGPLVPSSPVGGNEATRLWALLEGARRRAGHGCPVPGERR